MWLTGFRKKPELSTENWKELAPVGFFASLAHAFSGKSVMDLNAFALDN